MNCLKLKVLTIALMGFCAITLAQDKETLIRSLESSREKSEQLTILDSLTKVLVRSNDSDQVKYLRQAINLGIDLEDYDFAADKSRFILYQFTTGLKFEEALSLIDSLMAYKDKFKDPGSEGKLLLKKAGVLYALLDFPGAIENYQASIPKFEQSGDSIFMADAYLYGGQALHFNGNFPDAIKSLESAVSLYDMLGDREYYRHAMSEIIILLNENGLKDLGYERSITLINDAVADKDFCTAAASIVNIVIDYMNIKKDEEIEQLFIQMKEYGDLCENPYYSLRMEYHYSVQKLLFDLKRNDLNSARIHMGKLRDLETKIGDDFERAYSIYAKSSYYLKLNEIDKGVNLVEDYLDRTKKEKRNRIHLEIQKIAADLYAKNGNIAKSNQSFRDYIRLKDSIYTVSTANSYAFYQSQFEASQKEKEIIKQNAEINQLQSEQEIASNKARALSGLVAVVVLIGLGLFVFIAQRARNIRRKIEERLAYSKKELETFTDQLVLKINDHEILKKEYESLKNDYGSVEKIKKLHDLAYSKILTEEDWNNFKMKFDSASPNFFLKLRNKGFKFTNAEERLIALEKLQLRTNDIAKMLGISSESVITGRYRLRKKLSAPNDITIIEFLEAS